MAIPVKPEKGGVEELLTTNYAFYNVAYVSNSFSSNFLLNLDTGQWYSFDETENGGTFIEYPLGNPFDFIEPPAQVKVENFYNIILEFLDTVALSYSYPTIDNAISYYNSSVTAWADEAAAFNIWRDNTLSLMYENINGFTADGITLPDDVDGFTGQTGYQPLALGEPSRPQLLLFS